MQQTLYQFDGAPPSWRVRLGFAFKGVDPEIRSLSFSDCEHKSPEMLSLNPRARLPFIDAGTIRLQNSLAILAWLDREFPGPELFGSKPEEAAQIWQIVMDGYDRFREANRQMLGIVFSADNASLNVDELIETSNLAHAECRQVEATLGEGSDYLCGNVPSAADAVIFPEVRMIMRAIQTEGELMTKPGFQDMALQYPLTSSWMDRLWELPAVAETLPKHWSN